MGAAGKSQTLVGPGLCATLALHPDVELATGRVDIEAATAPHDSFDTRVGELLAELANAWWCGGNQRRIAAGMEREQVHVCAEPPGEADQCSEILVAVVASCNQHVLERDPLAE